MTRMFTIGGRRMPTWNVFVGCLFNCSYCNARDLALGRLKHNPIYQPNFEPRLVPERLTKTFCPGAFIFIAYMGDIYWIELEALKQILAVIEKYPQTSFLFLTKGPACFRWWHYVWSIRLPQNVYVGATIETNVDYGLSLAPAPAERFEALLKVNHAKKFVSIEPIMEFHLATVVDWMRQLKPDIIEVGADNYGNNLPEPPGEKVKLLLQQLRKFCPTVVEKEGLERLFLEK